jgi:excisionase family DNA binding protein
MEAKQCGYLSRKYIPGPSAGFLFSWEVISVVSEYEMFLTATESMKILRLKRSTFYEYVRQGIIPSFRIGHFLRFRRDDIINCNFGKRTN